MRSGKGDGRRRDNFKQLPDDVILVIFNDLWDAKLLFRCSMVCKRFASLTSQVHNLYLSLSHTQLDPYDPGFFTFYMEKILPGRLTNIFENLAFFNYRPPLKQIDSFDDLLESLELSVALSHFREIRHLRLDFPPFGDGTGQGLDLIKWGVSFSGEKIRTFTSLSIRTMWPIGHVPVRCSNEEDNIELYYPEHIRRQFLCRDWLLVAVMRHLLSLVLVKTQPELRSISFNELGFRQEEVISGDRIVELRELVSSTHWESLWGRVVDLKSSSGMVSCEWDSLTLPVSGYVTNLGMLIAIQFGDGSGGDYWSDIPAAALLDCFPEQDDVPREAIAEIWRPDECHLQPQ